jgi:hypothetical protein
MFRFEADTQELQVDLGQGQVIIRALGVDRDRLLQRRVRRRGPLEAGQWRPIAS